MMSSLPVLLLVSCLCFCLGVRARPTDPARTIPQGVLSFAHDSTDVDSRSVDGDGMGSAGGTARAGRLHTPYPFGMFMPPWPGSTRQFEPLREGSHKEFT
jgi:hypothetical protein